MRKTGINKGHEQNGVTVRETLLDAAERLFAEHGFDGVSMRQLTQMAGTNLASVNYHFGSKEKLFMEVIARRIRPINARRREMLEAVLAREEERPDLASLLEAFARPLFEIGTTVEQQEQLRRMIVRVFTEADGEVSTIFETELLPMGRQFAMAIAKARPQLSLKEIAMGLFFFVGALINLFVSMRRLNRLASVIGGVPENEEMFGMLVRSGVAIFDALGEEGRGESVLASRRGGASGDSAFPG